MDLEVALAVEGYAQVVGLDEAGRGALAGPVYAGAVVLPHSTEAMDALIAVVRDSKQLTARARLAAFEVVTRYAAYAAIGAASSEEIDELGIAPATRLAWVRALEVLPSADFLLLDAFPLPESSLPQRPIVHGDATCLSIAAASILAKTARDRFMIEAAAQSCVYGFSRNKGYGTREHLTALCEHGPGALHRRTFAPVRTWEQLRLGHLR